MTIRRHLWSELIAIERRRGPDAPYWLQDHINELLHADQTGEAARLYEVAKLYELLKRPASLQ